MCGNLDCLFLLPISELVSKPFNLIEGTTGNMFVQTT